MHFLNRTEYVNAVRDLPALKMDASVLLPADDMGDGFDNIAAVLGESLSKLEHYNLAE